MVASGNVGLAFGLVCAAGLSTTIGAACAFCARLAEPKFLAAGLGLSAGVMLYVSFVEIFMTKGVGALQIEWGLNAGYRNATLFFFAGILITAVLDQIVHFIGNLVEPADKPVLLDAKQPSITAKNATCASTYDAEAQCEGVERHHALDLPRPGPAAMVANEPLDDDAEEMVNTYVHLANVPQDMPAHAAQVIDTYISNDDHKFALKKMGLMTALAIGIHNLPEGLATFVATLADPVNGIAIAVAIALHNIPEGVCVAMPVYYATGSRWKGFMWAFISGLSEPIGGLLGWLVLYGDRMSNLTYGVLFTVVAGMMTYISIKELIPTALKYDPHDKIVSTMVILGMVIMAVSLLMFTI